MEPETKSSGAFVGLFVIILILIVGGIYLWMSNKPDELQNTKATPEAVTIEDSNALDALGQEATAVDANVGVDPSTIK